MIRTIITLALLLIALAIAGVGILGAAFMFSRGGVGPAVIGVIFAGALVLFAILILFGALAIYFSGAAPPPPNDIDPDDPDAPTPDDQRPDAQRAEPCIMCGYDLQNLPRRARCPECGFSYDLDDRADTFAP